MQFALITLEMITRMHALTKTFDARDHILNAGVPAESSYPFPAVKTVNTKRTTLDF